MEPNVKISATKLLINNRWVEASSGKTFPTINPSIAAAGTVLLVSSLDVPIDHTGPYRLSLGEATLPNGILRQADLYVEDLTPSDFLLTDEGVALEVLSRDDGQPIWNIYEHGWRAGLERVDVVIVFNVRVFDPGAVLRLRDIAVG